MGTGYPAIKRMQGEEPGVQYAMEVLKKVVKGRWESSAS